MPLLARPSACPSACPTAAARAPRRPRAAVAAAACLAVLLAGCAPPVFRSAVTYDDLDAVAPYGIRDVIVREWGDTITPTHQKDLVTLWAASIKANRADDIAAGRPIREESLALSGGGPDGAFGAGLLRGWTERGDRPEFQIVTGISTGAILALFAFLGPDYDDALEQIYTTYTTEQLLTRTLFSALTGGMSATDASGYRGLIEQYVDDATVARLAEEGRRGRLLLIGTTNLDAARPVIWNVTGIARSGDPDARRLIHDIIQASSAIPGAFPPVLIPVETDEGATFDEMHVDGGATQQLMFFAPDFPMRRIDAAVGVDIDRKLWIVVNNKLQKPYVPVRPRLLSIAGAAASSLLGGSGSGDIYRVFAIAARDGIDLSIISIPRSFDAEATEPFDPVYMSALFELGREMGRAGDAWSSLPPDFVVE